MGTGLPKPLLRWEARVVMTGGVSAGHQMGARRSSADVDGKLAPIDRA